MTVMVMTIFMLVQYPMLLHAKLNSPMVVGMMMVPMSSLRNLCC